MVLFMSVRELYRSRSVEGAMVQVFEESNTTAPIGRSETPLNVARPWTKKLEKDWKIVANQILHYNNPSVLSLPAEPVLSKSTEERLSNTCGE